MSLTHFLCSLDRLLGDQGRKQVNERRFRLLDYVSLMTSKWRAECGYCRLRITVIKRSSFICLRRLPNYLAHILGESAKMPRPGKGSYGDEKPPYSYIWLTYLAIQSSPNKELPLSAIYRCVFFLVFICFWLFMFMLILFSVEFLIFFSFSSFFFYKIAELLQFHHGQIPVLSPEYASMAE